MNAQVQPGIASVPVGKIIEGYLKLRAKKDAMKERHKAEMAPLNDMETKLEAALLAHLNIANVSSMAHKGIGTVFKTVVVSVTVEDWPATIEWIRQNGAWEFLERRVSKQVVQDFAEQHNEIPPGVKMDSKDEVRVRKA